MRKRLSLLWSNLFFFLGSVMPDVGVTVQFSFCHNDSLVRVECLKKSPPWIIASSLHSSNILLSSHFKIIHTMIPFYIIFMLIFTSIIISLWQNITTSHFSTPLDYDESTRVAIRTLVRKIFSFGSNVSVKEQGGKIRRYTWFGQQIARALWGFQIWFITILLKSWLLFTVLTRLKE